MHKPLTVDQVYEIVKTFREDGLGEAVFYAWRGGYVTNLECSTSEEPHIMLRTGEFPRQKAEPTSS